VLVALRIVANVAIFRLRKLEMANMAGALAIGLTLGLGAVELLVRGAFALVLNLLVYLNNDVYDVVQDLESPTHDGDKTRFLREHPGAATLAQLGLVAVLLAVALAWGGGLLVAGLAGGGICWAYSARLKRVPYVDVLAMLAWGVAMPLVGFPLERTVGWLIVGLLGLFSGCFESIQVMRDHDEDLRSGVRTTAVALGVVRTRRLLALLFVAAGVYGAAVFHPLAALGPGLAVLLPVPREPDALERYWTRVRVILGLTLVGACAITWWTGATAGLWVRVPVDAVLTDGAGLANGLGLARWQG